MDKKYYVVLSGAHKNAGDYLITEQCKRLLRYERPDYDLVQLDRAKSLENDLDLVNQSQALILMGGPAVSKDLYPKIYKLVDNLDDIKVPIVPMAVGWNSKRGDFKSMLDFKFTEKSQELIDRFASNGVGMSVRDSYTSTILKRHGVPNVFLTGCASWYIPEYFGQGIENKNIKKIAITPAQHYRFADTSKGVMKLVQAHYPDAEIACAFHRGIGVSDQYTDFDDAKNTKDLADFAESLGMKVLDLSYGYDNYQKYDDMDMHIGFRVHGHLYFLAHRKPSLLLNEDGRGKAMSETLGLQGVDAFQPTLLKKPGTAMNLLFKRINVNKRLYPDVRLQALDELDHLMTMHKDNDFKLMAGVYQNIDENYAVMKEFIHRLP